MQRKTISYQHFMNAAKSGRIEQVATFISENTKEEINGRNMLTGKTALLVAVENGKIEVVKRLLAAGGDPNLADKHHNTPLEAASWYLGNAEIFNRLLQAGATADPNKKVFADALFRAIEKEAIEMVQLLISIRIPLETVTNGSIPLIFAVKKGNIKIVELLLAAKANVNISDPTGNTAFIAAVKKPSVEIAKLLLKAGAKPEATSVLLAQALFDLIDAEGILLENEKEMLQLVLTAAPGIANTSAPAPGPENQQVAVNLTPLMYAIKMGKTKMVELLLTDKLTNVNAVTNVGSCALSIAAEHNKAEIFERLLNAGGDITAQNGQLNKILHSVAKANSLNCLKRLVKAGADVGIADQHGETALMYAVLFNHLAMVESLLAIKPQLINIKNLKGANALMLAAAKNHREVARILIKSPEIDLNAASEKGLTALMIAAMNGHTDMVYLLLEAGANPNLRTSAGETAESITKNFVIKDMLHTASLPKKLEAFERNRLRAASPSLKTLREAVIQKSMIEKPTAPLTSENPPMEISSESLTAEQISAQATMQGITDLTLDAMINNLAFLQDQGSYAGEFSKLPQLLRQFYEFLLSLNDPRLAPLSPAFLQAAANMGEPVAEHVLGSFPQEAPQERDRDKSPQRALTLFPTQRRDKDAEEDKNERRRERRT